MPPESSSQHATVEACANTVTQLCQPQSIPCCEGGRGTSPPAAAEVGALRHLPTSAHYASTLEAHAQQGEVIALALWMGQLLMDHGAESERVGQTVRACAESLGCPLSGVLVTYEALVVRAAAGDRHTAELRKVRPVGVNMSLLEELSHLCHRVVRGELGSAELARELTRVEHMPRHYPAWVTGLAVALACAAFSRLFGGDWGAFAAALAGAGGGMALRHYYAKLKPNRLFLATLSAAVATFIVGVLQERLGLSHTPAAALVASVLMLVPGVPAINTAQDMIKGHLDVAIARACEATLIVLSATLGLLLGVGLSQVSL
jgi:uncharacterized membrane protein YjjP (DUF1212 family)